MLLIRYIDWNIHQDGQLTGVVESPISISRPAVLFISLAFMNQAYVGRYR